MSLKVAYQWNRFGQIKNWVFEEEDRAGSLHGMQCARAEFVATLSLPSVFQEYLPVTTDAGRIQHPHAQEAVSAGPGCTEFSRVEDVYFFIDFNLIEISRLLDGSITTDVEVCYEVPLVSHVPQSCLIDC